MADAHGSGPCVGNNMRVQVPSPAAKILPDWVGFFMVVRDVLYYPQNIFTYKRLLIHTLEIKHFNYFKYHTKYKYTDITDTVYDF